MLRKNRDIFQAMSFMFFWGLLALASPPQNSDNPTLPGVEHQWLVNFSGQWQVDIKLWMAPGAEPLPYKTTSDNEMILGGRYLQMKSSGKMGTLQIGSLMLIGFDRRNQHFTMAGFDTMGTYGVTAAGTYSEIKKVVMFEGENIDPTTKKTTPFRFVLTQKNRDTFTLSLFFILEKDVSHQVAEMVYSRKAK